MVLIKLKGLVFRIRRKILSTENEFLILASSLFPCELGTTDNEKEVTRKKAPGDRGNRNVPFARVS